jgi:pimeloyl-ACP methyl ester carboxylesterase
MVSVQKPSRYYLRLIGFFAVALVLALLLIPVGLGVLLMWGVTHPGCPSGNTPADFDRPYEDIVFENTLGQRLNGYFLPGDAANAGATVLIAPGLGGGRGVGTVMDDGVILNRAGFNVLLFDSRVCAGGYHSLGYNEAADVEAAYAYLLERADVDPERVTVQGFSAGGATSLFATAQMPQLRGVVAKGNYHNFAEVMGLNSSGGSPFEALIRLGAEMTYRSVTGMDVRVLAPLDIIDEIAPRPILLIYGSVEVGLPGAELMLDRALEFGSAAELYVVEGSGHGGYLQYGGADYERRIIDFHRRVLLEN